MWTEMQTLENQAFVLLCDRLFSAFSFLLGSEPVLHATTFYIQRGLNYFKRLHFGVNSVAEIFKEKDRKVIA